jgi:hypothetical protein
MGHSSPSVGKPRTAGRGLEAKAPSLWEYRVQRERANKVPSERASCSREALSCMLAKWDEARMKRFGEGHRNGNGCFMEFHGE